MEAASAIVLVATALSVDRRAISASANTAYFAVFEYSISTTSVDRHESNGLLEECNLPSHVSLRLGQAAISSQPSTRNVNDGPHSLVRPPDARSILVPSAATVQLKEIGQPTPLPSHSSFLSPSVPTVILNTCDLLQVVPIGLIEDLMLPRNGRPDLGKLLLSPFKGSVMGLILAFRTPNVKNKAHLYEDAFLRRIEPSTGRCYTHGHMVRLRRCIWR